MKTIANKTGIITQIRARRWAIGAVYLLLGVALHRAPLVGGADAYWKGGVSFLWSDEGNWLAQSVPTRDDQIIFGKGSSGPIFYDLEEGSQVLGLAFSSEAGNHTLSGNKLALRSGGVSHLNGGTQVLALDLVLGQSSPFHIAKGQVHVTGAISAGDSTYGLTKSGTGMLVLSGKNSYTGNTRLNGGSTVIDFGTHQANVINPQSLLVLSGGSLWLKGAADSASSQSFSGVSFSKGSANTIGFLPDQGGGPATLDLGSSWAREGNSGITLFMDLTHGGKVTTQAFSSQTSHDADTDLFGYVLVKDQQGIGFGFLEDGAFTRYHQGAALQANTSNKATLNVRTSGHLTLNSGNKYFQTLEIDTTAEAGSLTFGADANLLRLDHKAILMTGSYDFVIANGQIGLSSQELILHQYGTGILTIGGRIGAGATRLSKAGPGTVILTAESSYTGATVVSGGALWVDGSLTQTSAVTISEGGTLGGNGVIQSGALVVVQAGATLSPGSGSVGIFRTGTARFEGGGRMRLELASTGEGGPGVLWDQYAITGQLDLRELDHDNPFVIELVSLGADGQQGPLGSWDGQADQLWESFITTTEGFLGVFDERLFQIDSSGFEHPFPGLFAVMLGEDGMSFDIAYRAIPEPATSMLLLASIAGGWVLLRRRRPRSRNLWKTASGTQDGTGDRT